MLKLASKRPYLMAAFVFACAVTMFFMVRLVSSTIYWSDPAHQNQKVAGWMTVGYISKSWDLNAPEIDALANLPLPRVKGHAQPLQEIAKDRGVSVAIIISEVEAAIAVLQQQKPAP